MTRFRHRPVEIEAVRWTGSNWDEITEAFAFYPAKVHHDPDSHSLIVDTREGRMRCAQGDWLVCDEGGDFYPHHDTGFLRSYEPITATAAAPPNGG